MTQIRRANKADCPRLLALIRELAVYEREPQAVTVSLSEFEAAGFGDHPIWEAFVAEQKGLIVGMSLFYRRYSTWKGVMLYLEDLIVTEDYRGMGIGKMLLDHTLDYSKEKGYYGMMWQVLDWNTPAINFYKKYAPEFDEQWLNVIIRNNKE